MDVCLNMELLNMFAAVCTHVYMDVGESLCVHSCACMHETNLGEGGGETGKGGAQTLERG